MYMYDCNTYMHMNTTLFHIFTLLHYKWSIVAMNDYYNTAFLFGSKGPYL